MIRDTDFKNDQDKTSAENPADNFHNTNLFVNNAH